METLRFSRPVETGCQVVADDHGLEIHFAEARRSFLSKAWSRNGSSFKVTGTRSEPHFGLDFHHKDEQPPEKPRRSRRLAVGRPTLHVGTAAIGCPSSGARHPLSSAMLI